MIVNIL